MSTPTASGPRLLFRGNLQRDLVRLAMVPCVVLAVALTGGFTQSRWYALDSAFEAEGQTLARHLAAQAGPGLVAGDLSALQHAADAALRSGEVTRVEISNSAGIYLSAGPATASMAGLRTFTAPIAARAAGGAPLGTVQTFRDTTAYTRERTRALAAAVGSALLTLLAVWAVVRRLARAVAQPWRGVARTVAALEAGDLTARCAGLDPTSGSDSEPAPAHEFARLARDIDRLAERLQRTRQRGEEQVREATAVALQRMAEAEQAALSRARFLAATSHDLRQPLHAMGLFIDGLLASATPAQRPAMQRLQESADFMGVLLDDLLEISWLDAQVLTPVFTAVSLEALFDLLEVQYARQVAGSELRLLWRDRGLAVRSDPALLPRIVGNLVANAIRHVPPDGTVLVLGRRTRDGGVRIEVRDNGVGVAPLHQARIFEEFYKVSNTERDRRQGFGIGLAICARIATLLGTRVTLRSALQQGSTFALTLPGADPAEVAPPVPEPIAPGALAHLHCLVVDDDPVILESSRTLLTQWGCQVSCAATHAEAVARLDAPGEHIDVLLCDLQLAGEDDGMTVIEAARQLQPEALAVLVSGATGPEVLQRLRKGGVMLLTKPVAPAKLRALLATRQCST